MMTSRRDHDLGGGVVLALSLYAAPVLCLADWTNPFVTFSCSPDAGGGHGSGPHPWPTRHPSRLSKPE